jgi:membrane protease YdiL (CAAX protease family)
MKAGAVMNKIKNLIRLNFDDINEASWLSIAVFSLLYCIYITFINLVVFSSNILRPIFVATSWLIDDTLIVNVVSILLFGYFIIMRLGKLNISDIGLKKDKIVNAILLVLVMWATVQIFNICAQLLISKKLVLYYGWNKYGAPRMLGLFIDQIFGNALFEEIAFRGFYWYKSVKSSELRKRA